MIDALRTIIQTTQVIEDTHVIITLVNPEGQQQSSSVSSGFVSNILNLSPDTAIDSLFNLNTESTLLIDVLVTTFAEPPLLFATTLPPPPTPLITHLQQTPVPTPSIVPSSSLQDLPNFSFLFVIIDAYLANKTHEAVKTVVELQSERLKDEAQAKNADFLNKLDDNIKKIIKDQESNTSHSIATDLSELELKKILIDKMESNKSIHISDEQKNLYKALVDAYESDKLILDTYRDTVSFKRRRDDEDKDEEPSTGSNQGSKRRQARKEPESTNAPKEKTSKTSGKSYEGSKSQHKTDGESAQTEKPMHTTKDLEEPAHQEFKIGVIEDQPNEEIPQFPDCSLAQKEDLRESFNELIDTPLDFLAFVMNSLKIDTLTLELLTGPTFKLMKGSCKSLEELEYLFEEVYQATTDQLDWNNPEGQQYPHDLRKPLLLIPNSRVMKTKAADYGHIKWIEDLVPNRMEFAQDVYSKRRIIFITKLEIVDWHNYKNLDWITVHRDDDKLYKFKEDDFNRLRNQDIEDMLLLLVQGKLTNLTVECSQEVDGTLNDVRTDLNDKDKAGAMIQEIDKQLKTRRIMRSLEKFVGGRPYKGDFRQLQRTI
ncbi:hypothetical protein Tco_0580505 [Tanacetum coccineum]